MLLKKVFSNISSFQYGISKIFCKFALSYLTAKHSKTLKIARLPNRYRYFLNSSLKVYSSNGYIKPLKI